MWTDSVKLYAQGALSSGRAAQLLGMTRWEFLWELITSNLVLSELVPLPHSRNFHVSQARMLATVIQIRALPNLVPTNIDPMIDQQAWELLYTNPQHPWSHVDATSIVLMRQLNISEVLTADHHFAQAGFTVLR
jgi:predicted nucleic acid-binding protein